MVTFTIVQIKLRQLCSILSRFQAMLNVDVDEFVGHGYNFVLAARHQSDCRFLHYRQMSGSRFLVKFRADPVLLAKVFYHYYE